MRLKTQFQSASTLLNEPAPENLANIFHLCAVQIPPIDMPDARPGELSNAHLGLAALQNGDSITACCGNASLAAKLMPNLDIDMIDQSQPAPGIKNENGHNI